jgi:NitT/TauT family transport system permease protein
MRRHPLTAILLPPLLTLIGLVLLWQLVVKAADLPRWQVPAPSDVAAAFRDHGPTLRAATFTTAQAALLGFAASAIVGIAVGIALSATRLIERAFYPFTLFLQTVPLIAIAPLLVLWFGVGLPSVTVSAFIVSLFPVIANTLAGMRSVDPALRDLFRLYGASRTATLFKLKLPFALPAILTGLRIASGLAVIGAIVGEFVAGMADEHQGLGILVLSANRNLQTATVFAAVLLAAALGLFLFAAISLLGHRLLRHWHASAVE